MEPCFGAHTLLIAPRVPHTGPDMRVAGLRELCDIHTFCRVNGQAACCKSHCFACWMKNASMFPFYYLQCEKFTRGEKPATRAATARLRFFTPFFNGVLPSEFLEKSRVILRILKKKIVFFRAVVRSFHHSSHKYHHSNNLKVSKISPAP